MSDSSVVRWLCELQQGRSAAAQNLWEFVHSRLLRLAEQEIGCHAHVGYDEEDIAQSAFHAFCRAIQQGRYGDIAGRDEMWRLLAVVTVNKARDFARRENRLRRGGGFRRAQREDLQQALVSPDPDATGEAILQEDCQQLLDRLGTRDLQRLALLKVDGYTNEEAAEHLGCTRRTVQRRLAFIRDVWAQEAMDAGTPSYETKRAD